MAPARATSFETRAFICTIRDGLATAVLDVGPKEPSMRITHSGADPGSMR
jgi:hypothetical protein